MQWLGCGTGEVARDKRGSLLDESSSLIAKLHKCHEWAILPHEGSSREQSFCQLKAFLLIAGKGRNVGQVIVDIADLGHIAVAVVWRPS